MDYRVLIIEVGDETTDCVSTIDVDETWTLERAIEAAEELGYTVMTREDGGCPETRAAVDVTDHIVTVWPKEQLFFQDSGPVDNSHNNALALKYRGQIFSDEEIEEEDRHQAWVDDNAGEGH